MSDKNSFDNFLEKNSKTSKTTSRKSGGSKYRSTKKDGGALVDDIKNLAVPFAILLAKQGIQSMYERKEPSENVAYSSPENSSKNSNTKDANTKNVNTAKGGRQPKKQKGGECPVCQEVIPPVEQPPVEPVISGGSKVSRRRKGGSSSEESIKYKYSELAERIERFLAKH